MMCFTLRAFFCHSPRLIRACREAGIKQMTAMAERGHELALFRLGLGAHTNQGKPLPRFLRRAAQQGFMQAMQKLGTYHCKRKEFKKAHHWLGKAAKKGDPESQHMLGLIFYYAKGEFPRNMKKAYRYFDSSAGAGYLFSKYSKGTMLHSGQGTSKNEKEGIKWLQEAAGLKVAVEIGDPEAIRLLEKMQK